MGKGGGKKQTVGYKYYFGVVTVPLRQHDAILEIELNDKSAWKGRIENGRITIDKPNLFGGKEREGGFVGSVDVQDGRQSQDVNSYYHTAKGGTVTNALGGLFKIFSGPPTSALRGCVSMVYRRPYWSANTARLPKLRTKHVNLQGVVNGWQEAIQSPTSRIDLDGTENYVVCETGNGTFFGSGEAIGGALAEIFRGAKGTGQTSSWTIHAPKPNIAGRNTITFTRNNVSTDEGYEELAVLAETLYKDTVNTGSPDLDMSFADNSFRAGGANELFSGSILATLFLNGPYSIFSTAASSVSNDLDEEKRRNIFIIRANGGSELEISDALDYFDGLSRLTVNPIHTPNFQGTYTEDGEATLEALDIGGLGVARALGGGAIKAAMARTLTDWVDCNPAHMIRDLWINPMRGGTVAEADIGTSFETVAQTLFDEGFGLSAKYRGIDQADSDRLEIERHADLMSYRSNRTGKIELVAVRDDYTVGDLITLDRSIVTDWSGLSRPRKSEIANQLTVKYTRRDGKTGSVTRTNPAGVRRAGRVIKAEDVRYPYITTEALAVRVCLRDLSTLSTDVISGSLPLTYLPEDLEPGSVFLLNEPALGYDNIIMRVTETRIGQHDDSSATIQVVEDRYASTQELPDVVDRVEQTQIRPALSPNPLLVREASYFQLILENGELQTDAELTEEPDLGRVFVTGARANEQQLEATLATKISPATTWVDEGLVTFGAYGVLQTPLSRAADDVTFAIAVNESVDGITAGDVAILGNEIIRIDNLEIDQANERLTVTCGRACLDSIPELHSTGSTFVVINTVAPLEDDFVAGASVDVKVLSRTGSSEQTLSGAPTNSLTFGSRAIRPYPVGDLKLDGSYDNLGILSGSKTLTWAHRDRTTQTTTDVDDHTAADIGPEDGVYYETVIQTFGRSAGFYDPTGMYERRYFYLDETVVDEVAALTTPAQATSQSVTLAPQGLYTRTGFYDPDKFYFGSFGTNTILAAAGVRTYRDDSGTVYDNLQTPIVYFQPLYPVTELEATEI